MLHRDNTNIRKIYEQLQPELLAMGVTVGYVVDENDPQQSGRLRVFCPALNDKEDADVNDIPWARYASSFGGAIVTPTFTRGPEEDSTDGPIAYGFWNIPHKNAEVLVCCIDGNPAQRIWFASLMPMGVSHTMPHGRYFYNKSGISGNGMPEGPLSSIETAEIQPLYANQAEAFTDRTQLEWASRGADFTLSAVVDPEILSNTLSSVLDDADIVYNGFTYRQGYQLDRMDYQYQSPVTGKNLSNQVYAWVTPGFHAISMDDRMENCRMRLRTTSGHQILLDDTNERIYVATARGKNWIELDQSGNIDVYSERNISFHAAKDINFTADQNIRMYATEGIHLHSEQEIRATAKQDMSLHSDQNVQMHGLQDVNIESGQDVNIKSGAVLSLGAGTNLEALSGDQTKITSTNNMNLKSLNSDFLISKGGYVYINDAINVAQTAIAASGASDVPAFFTSRIPQHECWPRTMTKDDTTLEPEFPPTSDNVNRIERGELIIRGHYWRR